MKKVILLILLIACCTTGYWLFDVINAPIEFEKTSQNRKKAVIERIKDIRSAQRAYKRQNGHFANSFDSLIQFVKNDSMDFEIRMGSADDSVAVKEGRVKTIKVRIAVKDTVFGKKKLNFDDLRYIPYSDNQEFKMAASIIETGAQGVKVPVFCASAEYKTYLGDLDNQQELINMYDFDKTVGRFPGVKVGSMERATNEAGNWED